MGEPRWPRQFFDGAEVPPRVSLDDQASSNFLQFPGHLKFLDCLCRSSTSEVWKARAGGKVFAVQLVSKFLTPCHHLQ